MNETNKLNKIKEARELGLTLIGHNLSEHGFVQINTDFHIQKTMNQKSWIGSMNCGARVGMTNSLDYYDIVINNASKSMGKLGMVEVKVLDLVCTDCLEKI